MPLAPWAELQIVISEGRQVGTVHCLLWPLCTGPGRIVTVVSLLWGPDPPKSPWGGQGGEPWKPQEGGSVGGAGTLGFSVPRLAGPAVPREDPHRHLPGRELQLSPERPLGVGRCWSWWEQEGGGGGLSRWPYSSAAPTWTADSPPCPPCPAPSLLPPRPLLLLPSPPSSAAQLSRTWRECFLIVPWDARGPGWPWPPVHTCSATLSQAGLCLSSEGGDRRPHAACAPSMAPGLRCPHGVGTCPRPRLGRVGTSRLFLVPVLGGVQITLGVCRLAWVHVRK